MEAGVSCRPCAWDSEPCSAAGYCPRCLMCWKQGSRECQGPEREKEKEEEEEKEREKAKGVTVEKR